MNVSLGDMFSAAGALVAAGAIYATYHVYEKGRKAAVLDAERSRAETVRLRLEEQLRDREFETVAQNATRKLRGIYNDKMRNENRNFSIKEIAGKLKLHVLDKHPSDDTSHVWNNIHICFISVEQIDAYRDYLDKFSEQVIRRFKIEDYETLIQHGIQDEPAVVVYQGLYTVVINGPKVEYNNKNRNKYKDLGGRCYE